MRFFTNKVLSLLIVLIGSVVFAGDTELTKVYEEHCRAGSDINEHLPVLKKIASDCSSVTEMGIRSVVSTWGLFQGLSENGLEKRSYLGIDLALPEESHFAYVKQIASNNGIKAVFVKGNNMDLDIDYTDMLFIDTLHTYAQLTYELEKFSPKVFKYIVMHDTSDPWGSQDEPVYYNLNSSYPSWIDTNKRGLWNAVEDFLQRHPEWTLQERYFNNHGLTVLRRA